MGLLRINKKWGAEIYDHALNPSLLLTVMSISLFVIP